MHWIAGTWSTDRPTLLVPFADGRLARYSSIRPARTADRRPHLFGPCSYAQKAFLLLSGDGRWPIAHSHGIVMLIAYAAGRSGRRRVHRIRVSRRPYRSVFSAGDQNNCSQSFLRPLFTQLFVFVAFRIFVAWPLLQQSLKLHRATPWRSAKWHFYCNYCYYCQALGGDLRIMLNSTIMWVYSMIGTL